MIGTLRHFLMATLAVCALAIGHPAFANTWGVFADLPQREWRTDGEPRPRISLFAWDESGRVLVGKHGFESRRDGGAMDFADTTQRLVLDPPSGNIAVTYEYADGRAPLRAFIQIAADGTATESFTDSAGIEKRNVYTLPNASVTMIERQEFREGRWIALGRTRKLGMTPAEIAEKKLREEHALRFAAAQAAAQKAQEEAFKERMLAQQQAEREEEQARQASQPNALQILQGMAQQIDQQNRANQARFERQMAADIAEEKRREAERLRAQAEEQSRRVAEANARQEAIRQQFLAKENAAQAETSGASTAVAPAATTRGGQAEGTAKAAAAEAQRVQREKDEARQKAEADAVAQKAQIAKQQAESERLRREQEAKRPVAWKEGVVLCKQQNPKSWRCDGPLQVDYGNVEDESGLRAARMACGGGSPNKLGMWSGFMAYGCGFGIHPTDRQYPGNRDIPAMYGVGMPPGTRTFYCPKSVNAYCRGS